MNKSTSVPLEASAGPNEATLPSAPLEVFPVQAYPGRAHEAGAEDPALARPSDRDDPAQIEKLRRELGVLTAQNRQMLTSLSHLLDLYETEKAQRRTLQASLDRVLEDMTAGRAAVGSETLAAEIRQGVSDELKPLLHAIIDLLEITMRRTPSSTTISSEVVSTAQAAAPEPDANDHFEPADDLPRTLPQILTKSLEELAESARGKAAEERDHTGAHRRGAGSESGDGRDSPGPDHRFRRHNALPGESRGSAWIPVTSDMGQR